MSLLDYFRRPRLEPLNAPLRRGALTASARVLTPAQGKALAKGARNRAWQEASFTYRTAIPEVGYVMRFLGNNSTHIRLFAGDRRGDDIHELDADYGIIPGPDGTEVRDPDALPPDVVALAQDALDRLTGSAPSGGGAAILAPLVQAYEGPGECFLVGRYDPEEDVETWAIHSISELTPQDGRYPGAPDDAPRGYWRLNTGEGRDAEKIDLDPATTTVYRLWTADARWSSEPDSPMRSLVGTCERLLLIDRANDGVLRSRAAGNGFLLMPDEMGFGGEVDPDDPDAPPDDSFQRDMATQLTTPLVQDGSAASAVPGVIYGPYAYLDRIRHLTVDRPLDPKLAELEARLLTRLGIGLDVPPEVLTGYADVNHWNVNQVSEDTFKLHQEPVTIKAVESLTLGYMRTSLLDAGVPRELADRVVIWFDPASLIAPRDQREAANDAYDRQAISAKAYRRLLHLDEQDAPEMDAAQPDEPVGATGLLAGQLTTLFDIAGAAIRAGYAPDSVSEQLGLDGFRHTGFRPITVAEPEVPIIEGGPSIAPEPPALPAGSGDETTPPPTEETPEVEATVASGASSTGATPTAAQRRLSRRLMRIDRDLRARLQVAADAALHRALERAGNRLRAKTRGYADAAAKVDGVPGPLVAAALGRALVAALDADDADLLREAFERFRTQWTEWTATAAEDAIDTAARITGLDRSDEAVQRTVATLRDSFADGAEAAWPTLEAQLNDLATGLMYEPNPEAEALGEIPDTMVPPGLIRSALAVAGGLPADHPGFAAAGQFLPGLTSGQLLRAFLRDAGAEVVEYEWAYGISSRPFPPHEALDGVVFSDFNDPALSSSGTGGEWVGDHLAPGDHDGCHCDAALIYADGNTRDEQELIGRTSYAEQKPGKTVPGWDATVDGKTDTPRIRPELRRAAPEAALTQPPAPLLTTEQHAALLPRRGGWTTSTRNQTLTALKATPEGRTLVKVLDSFQSGTSVSIPRLRTDIQKTLNGAEDVPEGRRESVRTLLNAIHHGDAGERPLYRGMRIPGTPEEVLARYAPGSQQDIMLASFSSDKKLATDFTIKGAGQKVRGQTQTGVLIEWTSGPKHALPIENLGKSRVFANEREWVGAGRYRVVDAKVAKRGGNDVVVVTMEQEAVWGPGGEALTAAGLPPDLHLDPYLNTTLRELDPTAAVARSLTDNDEPADPEETP